MLYLRRILGLLIALGSAVVVVLSVVALLDPVGTKMADDPDPFGAPDPWYVPTLRLLASVAVGAFGLWLAASGIRKSKMPEPGMRTRGAK